MDRDNELGERNVRAAIEPHVHAICEQLRRIRAFLRNLRARSPLIERIDAILFRPIHRFVVWTAHNIEQDAEYFIAQLFRWTDVEFRDDRPQYLRRIVEELEELVAGLQEITPFLRHMVDPTMNMNLNDPAFQDFVLGDGHMQNAGATDQEIELLERVEAGVQEEGEQCAICLEEYVRGESLIEMPCGHVFHPACVTDWLLRNAICPIDRVNMFTGNDTRT